MNFTPRTLTSGVYLQTSHHIKNIYYLFCKTLIQLNLIIYIILNYNLIGDWWLIIYLIFNTICNYIYGIAYITNDWFFYSTQYVTIYNEAFKEEIWIWLKNRLQILKIWVLSIRNQLSWLRNKYSICVRI